MKQYLLTLSLSVFTFVAYAQNDQHRSTVSATAGLNGWQFFNLLNNVSGNDSIVGLDIDATGSYGLTYDYGITKWFSLGGAVNFNKIRIGADQIKFNLNDENSSTFENSFLKDFIDEDVFNVKNPAINIARTTISTRALFHYANSGRIDLYSGFRLGAKIRRFSIEATDADTNERKDIGGTNAGFNFQFIPFGLRGYITENIGLGFEAAVGAPHYLAFQLNYRFGGGGAGK